MAKHTGSGLWTCLLSANVIIQWCQTDLHHWDCDAVVALYVRAGRRSSKHYTGSADRPVTCDWILTSRRWSTGTAASVFPHWLYCKCIRVTASTQPHILFDYDWLAAQPQSSSDPFSPCFCSSAHFIHSWVIVMDRTPNRHFSEAQSLLSVARSVHSICKCLAIDCWDVSF